MPSRGKKHVVVTTLDSGGPNGGSDVDDYPMADEAQTTARLPPASTGEVAKTKRTASAAQLEALKRARDRAKALRDDARGQTATTTAERDDPPKSRQRGRSTPRHQSTEPSPDVEVDSGPREGRRKVAAPRRKRVERPMSPPIGGDGAEDARPVPAGNDPTGKRPRRASSARRDRSPKKDSAQSSQTTHVPVKPREPSPPPPPAPPSPPPPPPPPREPSPPPPPASPPPPPPRRPGGFMRSLDGVFFFNRDDE